MDRKMTLTNGASSGNAGVNPGGGFGFDAANLSASANMQILLQTNNDLILSIYKTIVDSTQEINRKIEALRDDIRDIKLNQQRNDRTLQEEATMWRTHTEQLLAGQGSRHLQDVSRLQDMLMKFVVSQPPQLSTSTGGFVTQEAVGGGFATSATAPVVTAPAAAPVAIPLTAAAIIQATTTMPSITSIAPIITTAPSIVASTTPLSTTSPYTIHSAPSFTTTKPTFVTYTPAITTTTPTVTSTMSSTTTNTTFGVTGTVPFGGSLFGGGNNAGTNTFANLAAKAAQSKPGQAGGGFLSGNNGGISSDGSKQSLFGASPFSVSNTTGSSAKDFKFFTPHTKTETRGDGDESDKEDETAEDYTPDVHYEPVVPLPPEVEVVSGEEGEEVTFVARCKLYRYDRQLKENKERGLGDIKILFNPTTKKYRCVMRREKVFKICANFPVVHDLSLHKREQMPTVYTWACKDFSEDTVGGLDETFTARFKDASIAEEFHQVCLTFFLFFIFEFFACSKNFILMCI
uniref:RanBD1 domain-containing protein n=1 Tax=Meloidogyne enterolobii TaxID=390850 RepID=A0A6V7UQL0_MELEN|nr:unnamed protein product [Meloidogyne enterolobii]